MFLQLRLLIILIIIFAQVDINVSNAQYLDDEYIAWNPTNNTIAVTSMSEVLLVDSETNLILNKLIGFSEITVPLVWSPDGNSLAVVSDESVTIWYRPWLPNEVQNTHSLTNEKEAIYRSIAWSPDGSSLALSWLSQIDIWDIQSNDIIKMIENESSVAEITWGMDEQSLFVSDGEVILQYDLSSGDWLRFYVLRSNNPTPDIYSAALSLDVSPDGTYVIVGTDDGTARLWEYSETPLKSFTESMYYDNETIHLTDNHLTEIAWHPTYPLFVASSLDAKVYIYNIATHTYDTIDVGTPVYSVAWSPDGTGLAYLDSSRSLHILTITFTDDGATATDEVIITVK